MTTSYSVDVIIPTYNSASYIADAIISASTQTIQPQKIIVVDDGSSDETKAVVERVALASPVPVEYLYQTNAGPNAARNAGLRASQSTFVAFLDADDRWLPNKLERQLSLYETSDYKNLGLVYCKYEVITSSGEIANSGHIVPLDTTLRGMAFERLLKGNKVLGSASAVLIKRGVFDEVGMFDEGLRIGEDWDMWLRIAEQYAIDFIDETLVQIRVHNQNQGRKLFFVGILDFYKKWLERLDARHIPQTWRVVIGLSVVRHPQMNGRYLRAKLALPLRKKLFPLTLGSAYLYGILALLQLTLSPWKWGYAIRKLRQL